MYQTQATVHRKPGLRYSQMLTELDLSLATLAVSADQQQLGPQPHYFSRQFLPRLTNEPSFEANEEESVVDGKVLVERRKSTRSSGPMSGFLQNSKAEDILFIVLSYLDAVSLTRAAQVCNYWNALTKTKYTQQTVWKNLCEEAFLRTSVVPKRSKSFYKLYKKIYDGKFYFAWFNESAEFVNSVDAGEPSSPDSPRVSNAKLSEPRFISAWAVDPLSDFICLVDNFIVFFDKGDSKAPKAIRLDGKGTPIPESFVPLKHDDGVQLFLNSGSGKLISFDNSSTIYVWDMKKKIVPETKPLKIQANNILTLNVDSNQIIICEHDGKITVFNSETGKVRFTYQIQAEYATVLNFVNFVNVAVWHDVLVYAAFNGMYYCVNMKTGKEISRFNVLELDLAYKDRELAEGESRFAPMTMSISGNVLLTNGPGYLTVWDYKAGKHLYSLTNETTKKRLLGGRPEDLEVEGNAIPALSGLQHAEISKDGTVILGSATCADGHNLLVWDFTREVRNLWGKGNRVFERRFIEQDAGNIEFWVGFDEGNL
ncbi:hypothetical protein HK098_002587 [Nowakowskiella sp. JEL0407]|nr:hypothetical protein HK098_002587 [Nowakowskiella sp. JEL0407]